MKAKRAKERGKDIRRRFVSGHSDSDRKNSWYWMVLLKKYGSYEKAEQSIIQSRKMVDPLYDLNKVFKI